MTSGADVQAAFAAALVDEWARGGVTDAVMAPGSRSTPMVLAVAGDARIRVHRVLDERDAGFLALGLGLAGGRPAVAITTSGTASVELHPAVVEAHQGGVPLIVVTTDRPPELHGVGAPQTVDQELLFGPAVRWSVSPGVPDRESAHAWRPLAARSVAEATGGPAGPGPVHLNLAFREPLLGVARPDLVPEGRSAGAPWHRLAGPVATAPPNDVVTLLASGAGRPGLIVAGAGAAGGAGAPDAKEVVGLASALGWPLLADPRSGCRLPGGPVVAGADALLRTPEVAGWRPEIVLRLGQPWASRVVNEWLAGLPAETVQILVDPYDQWADPDRRVTHVVRADPGALCRAVSLARRGGAVRVTDWASQWRRAEDAAQRAMTATTVFSSVVGASLSDVTGTDRLTEPGVARAVMAGLPAGATLVASSSMPVRDLEWYGEPRHGVTILSNRGANGIDGVIATTLGAALASGQPTYGLLGDLAFLYDAGALVWAEDRDVDCVLVVVDNDGGGIFSFLPQAHALGAAQFERYWGTPHGRDLATVAAAYGVTSVVVATVRDLVDALVAEEGGRGVRVIVVRTDRHANVADHEWVNQAVATAVSSAFPPA